MSFLTLGAYTLPVLRGGTQENASLRIGSIRRTFNGSARSSVRAEKQMFSIALAPMSTATFALLRAATALGAPVVCTGDFNDGASKSYLATITTAGYVKPYGGAVQRLVVIELQEV